MLKLHEFLSPGRASLRGAILGHTRSSDASFRAPSHTYHFFPMAGTMLVWHGVGRQDPGSWEFLEVDDARLVVMRPGPHMTPCPTAQGSLVTLLRPGTLRRLFGVSAAALPPHEVRVRDLGHDVAGLEEAMAREASARDRADVLEAWMEEVLSRTRLGPSPCSALHRAISMRRLPNARALAAHSGLSERQLRRHFLADVGVSPKHYLRLLRFRAALPWALTPTPPDWRALDLGFYDQSHMIHEFRDFLGVTPEALRALAARSSPLLDGLATPMR